MTTYFIDIKYITVIVNQRLRESRCLSSFLVLQHDHPLSESFRFLKASVIEKVNFWVVEVDGSKMSRHDPGEVIRNWPWGLLILEDCRVPFKEHARKLALIGAALMRFEFLFPSDCAQAIP